MCEMRIKIDGEIHEISSVFDGGYLPMIETSGGESYYLAVDDDDAREAARKYWHDLATQDPDEFLALVGEETVVSLWLDQLTLDEWLTDIDPAAEFGSWDGTESTVDRVGQLTVDLGFTPYVAYRC